MEILRYLQPDNPIAWAIVTILQILFGVWMVLLGCWWRRLVIHKNQMRQSAEVRLLAEALRGIESNPGEGYESGSGQSSHSVIVNVELRESKFREFCEDRNIKEESLVARHLKPIFDAGCSQGRLEVSELIKYTTNELFKINGLLRSLLATFIVIGLLGTLFGLADSLSQLSPISPGVSVQSNEQISTGLTLLLIQLKSAFAPSIWGISFTIIGLFIFTLYLQLGCSPVRKALEHLTLTVWVPQLFPNTSQRLQETIQLSEEQIRKNLESIQTVAVFAQSIQNEIGGLNESFKAASKSLRLLEKSSTQINTFADKFVEGAKSLASFESELRALYQQMIDDSKAFHESVEGSIKDSEVFHNRAQEILDNQHKQLQVLLTALKTYEDAYIDSRTQIDSRLEEVLSAAKNAFDDIGNRNREMVEAIGNPLREELVENLGEIQNTLTVQLKSIKDRIGTFDVPIKTASENIAGSLETVVRRTESLTQELQREILKQNEEVQREILKQDEKNREQLKNLGEVNKQITSLLEELKRTREFQGAQSQTVSRDINSLAQNVASLGNSLASISQNFNLTGQSFQQLERLTSQYDRIAAELGILSQGLSGMKEKVGAIGSQVETSIQSLKTTIQRQPGRTVNKTIKTVVPGDHARSLKPGPASTGSVETRESPGKYETVSITREDAPATEDGKKTWIGRIADRLPFRRK
ncbi:MAG: hypothetical protein L0229_24620 [Blastocatellia bacterium]|nr:hypothetical protein [Blastocatellia bacterium]